MTAPSYRSGGIDDYYTATTVTLTAPSGVASGDVLTAVFINNDGTRTLSTLPSGWTQIISKQSGTGPGFGFWLCKKIAGGSEPASYDFEFDFSFNGLAAIVAVQDGDDVSIVGASTTTAGSTTPYAVNTASVTTPDDDSLLLWFGAMSFTTTGTDPAVTVPTGFTSRLEFGNTYTPWSLTVADKAQASAGASGTANGSIACSGAGAANAVGVLVAVAPTGGATTAPVSGDGEFPIIKSVLLGSSGITFDVGNYGDIPVTVADQDGTGLAGLSGTITSSNTSVATVSQLAATDSTGQATVRIVGVAAGSATVTATFDSVVSNQVAVSVSSAASKAISITPTSAALQRGQTRQFTASVSGDSSATFGWSVESGGGSVGAFGLYTAPNSDGTAVVRATYQADSNIYAEATVTTSSDNAPATATVTLRRGGAPFSGQSVDYWVISSGDVLITSGTGTTDSTGALEISVDNDYSGQTVLVVVNNVGSDMDTTGKIQGQFVVTVA